MPATLAQKPVISDELMWQTLRRSGPSEVTTSEAAATVGTPIEMNSSLRVIFVTGVEAIIGKWTYKTLPPEFVPELTKKLIVDAPPELGTPEVTAEAARVAVPFAGSEGEGFLIVCRVTLTPTAPGIHKAVVAFQGVRNIQRLLKARLPDEVPRIEFTYHVLSVADREKMQRDEKERREAEEQERTVAEAKKKAEAEQQRVEDDRKRAEEDAHHRFWMWLMGACAFVGLGVLALAARMCLWLFPAAVVRLGYGASQPARGKVRVSKNITEAQIHDAIEPYTVETTARSFLGRKVDVTVHLIALSGERTVNQVTSYTQYEDGRTSETSVSYVAETKYEVAISAQSGRGVPRGTCLASTPAGRVKVIVT